MFSSVVFAPDDRYDRDHASDSQSRYAAYLRRHVGLFLDADDQPTRDRLEFAGAAWRIAQSSTLMSPPYVTAHPRVLGTDTCWDHEGRLAIAVEVATDLPREYASSLRDGWIGWERCERWPEQADNGRVAATAVLHFRVPMSAAGLPEPAYHHVTAEPDIDIAKNVIEVVCGRLNAVLGRVLAAFDDREVA